MAAVTHAGDIFPGHPPTARARTNPGILAGLLAAVLALVGVVAGRVRARPGIVADALFVGLVVAGVFVLAGTGAGLIATGLGGLVVKEYGG